MIKFRVTALTAVTAAVVLAWPGRVSAQAGALLLDSGIAAYQELDLAAATGFLQRALGASGDAGLTADQHASALSYLGAAEYLQGSLDSAEAAYRRLVVMDPRHTLDELLFPPEMTALFARVKRETKVVQVIVPPVVRFQAGEPAYEPHLVASSFHRIVVTIDARDGTAVRRLFEGLIGDSLDLEWDGLTTQGDAVEAGRYQLRVESQGPTRETLRVVRVPLDVSAVMPDTLPYPEPPSDSVLLPERAGRRPGLEALVGGLAAGVGIVVLPSLVASDAQLSGTRIVVGSGVAIAGVFGFLRNRPGAPISANIEHNRAVRESWQLDVDRAADENRRRLARPRLVVEAGEPSVIGLGTP